MTTKDIKHQLRTKKVRDMKNPLRAIKEGLNLVNYLSSTDHELSSSRVQLELFEIFETCQ